MTVDALDRKILSELQHNGRMPFREVGRRLSVSERTIRTRVRRLEEEGVLRILAFVDPLQLESAVLAFMLLRIESGAHEQVVDKLVSWPEVTYVSTLIGRADLYVQVICPNNEALWDLVTQRLRLLEGILETETTIEVTVHKFSYVYPDLS